MVISTLSRFISQWYTDFLNSVDYTFEYFPAISYLFTVFCCLFKNIYASLSVFCEFKVFALLILGSHKFLISELIKFGLCFRILLC